MFSGTSSFLVTCARVSWLLASSSAHIKSIRLSIFYYSNRSQTTNTSPSTCRWTPVPISVSVDPSTSIRGRSFGENTTITFQNVQIVLRHNVMTHRPISTNQVHSENPGRSGAHYVALPSSQLVPEHTPSTTR